MERIIHISFCVILFTKYEFQGSDLNYPVLDTFHGILQMRLFKRLLAFLQIFEQKIPEARFADNLHFSKVKVYFVDFDYSDYYPRDERGSIPVSANPERRNNEHRELYRSINQQFLGNMKILMNKQIKPCCDNDDPQGEIYKSINYFVCRA